MQRIIVFGDKRGLTVIWVCIERWVGVIYDGNNCRGNIKYA